jgi:putative alpha-1,2-mannosidase
LLVIKTENNTSENIYIQALDLNGKPVSQCWMPREELMKGGTLTFTMGPEPEQDWGIGEPPPSASIKQK